MEEINFQAIEKKWQERWEKEKIFEVEEDFKKEKYYVLEMFPYPSAVGLHMGHALNYAIGDVFARYKRMNNFNVLYPMGFDAMGLPAENAAIKAGERPNPFTKNAIKNYIRQMKELGLSYDWSKTISTMDPEYYKWNQYFFLKFLENGLIYRKKSAVNWCPKCNTVLANEQVQGGKCWRHDDTDVEIKHLDQWYMKTTKYADELIEGLKDLKWPEKIKAMQKNWIGKSYGTEIDFEIKKEKWPIFTTRPDTIFGVTFMVISAQHEKLMDLVTGEQKLEVEKFLKEIKSISEKEQSDLEKEGVFTGSYAINPATKEKVPIYVGNFVVADYGSGMVMAVPAHDQRDFEFANKYKISIKQVIEGNLSKTRAWTESGKLINSEKFTGLENEQAKKEISSWLEKQGKARQVINYKLRDWGFSRQRYWGTPIPIVHCERCGIVPVPEKDLPIILPEKVEFGKGNPLETNKEWIEVKCPKCGSLAKRETETMDTFFDSSWYFLRYPDNKNLKEPFNKEKIKDWLPVNQYIGGAEHACMHLIYARFFTKVLRDLKMLDFNEPFLSLFNQGMLYGEGGVKMSKSKPQTCVLPDEVSVKYGMDTARFFLLSLASPNKPRDWSEHGIQGSLRFIRKIFNFFDSFRQGDDSEIVKIELNKTIKKVNEGIESFEYRDALIKLREFLDLLSKQESVSKQTLEKSLKLLSPFCPHIAEELWEKFGHKDFISLAEWPRYEEIKEVKKKEDLNKNIIEQLKPILEKFPDKNNIYLYVLPFEVGKIDAKKIAKEVGKMVDVWPVNEPEKYDPENKSKKALPGKPGIYLE
jgi:leucyl-tRNA synthetase